MVEITDSKNYKNHRFGVYHADTDSVQVFDDTKKDQSFFRYPKNLQQTIPFALDTMMITGPIV
ncbi:MAG: hypothetical protein WCG98_10460 [bacterium]